MRLPRFWTKAAATATSPEGEPLRVEAWGWSETGLGDAEKTAVDRARKALTRLLKGETETPAAEYDYLAVPLREEIVETHGAGERPTAAITLNRYGSLVLNTASVLFADIDFPPPRSRGFFDAILLAFSTARRQNRAEEERQQTLAAIKGWIARNPQRTLRLYRTAAGLRLLFTDRTYDPASAEVLDLLRELGSDALYIRLTRRQESFRARLTPKPWRCGMREFTSRFPFKNEEDERKTREWQEEYGKKSAGHRACDLVLIAGRDAQDPAIRAIVELHDRRACEPRGGRLA